MLQDGRISLEIIISLIQSSSMITTVTGKNQITIPSQIAKRAGIHSGSRVEWQVLADGSEILCRVLPDPPAIARKLLGAGKKFLRTDEDPIGQLVRERAEEE
jgi:AbrB family looped-hinge helix DNA binding protein